MTQKEVLRYLHNLKWVLANLDYGHVAGLYEDAELRLCARRMTPAQCREYANTFCPPGKRGRVRLSLSRPVEARAIVLLRWLLRNITD